MHVLNLRAGTEFKMGAGSNWRVVSPDMGARQLTLNHSIHAPGQEFPQHIHDGSEDCFIILEGATSVRQGDIYTPLYEGEAAFIPVGEVHGTVNTTDARVRLISFQSPPDLALYSGARDKGEEEVPRPPDGHESAVQIISLQRGGPCFGRPGDWRVIVSPDRGSQHLVVHYLDLPPGTEFDQRVITTEVIYVVLSGGLSAEGPETSARLSADDVLFITPGERASFVVDDEGARLVRTQAQG